MNFSNNATSRLNKMLQLTDLALCPNSESPTFFTDLF